MLLPLTAFDRGLEARGRTPPYPQKIDAVVASTIGIDTGKNTLHLTAVEVARGSFRLVTGSQSKGVTYQIKTPFGTLGVRG